MSDYLTKSQENALKILVCYHKPYILPSDDKVFLPIQGGKAISDLDLHIQGDNEINGHPCDNISDKNPIYGEFTSLYWAWKNLKKLYPEVKYVGWTHYRRFFAFNEKQYFTPLIKKTAEEIQNYRVDSDEIIKILESGKVIMARKSIFGLPLYLQYSTFHSGIDYQTLKRVVRDKFPDFYEEFINFMEYNNKMSLFCMFIMKYDDFIEYCNWLFSLLAEMEPLLPFQYYNQYQKRALAFMAERLINVYMRKKRMKIHELNVFFYGEDIKNKSILSKIILRIRSVLAYVKAYVKCEISFWLTVNRKKSPKG